MSLVEKAGLLGGELGVRQDTLAVQLAEFGEQPDAGGVLSPFWVVPGLP